MSDIIRCEMVFPKWTVLDFNMIHLRARNGAFQSMICTLSERTLSFIRHWVIWNSRVIYCQLIL